MTDMISLNWETGRRGPKSHPAYRVSDSGCWEWMGYVNTGGYGVFRGRPAHRVSYELSSGVVPEGMELDHLCRNRRCINPAHLEPVTRRENVLRGTAPSAFHAIKTHCKNGHELTPDNLYRRPSQPAHWRQCRKCKRARQRLANKTGWTRGDAMSAPLGSIKLGSGNKHPARTA